MIAFAQMKSGKVTKILAARRDRQADIVEWAQYQARNKYTDTGRPPHAGKPDIPSTRR